MFDTNDKNSIHLGHRARLRERFLREGFNNMQAHEVLELILFYVVPRRDTNVLAHNLIRKYGSLKAVLSAPVEQLETEPFINRQGAVLLNMFGKSGEYACVLCDDKPLLNTPKLVKDYMKLVLSSAPKESFVVVCLDKRDRLLKFFTIKGTVDAVSVHVREIVQQVLNANATSVILGHNHPSGDVTPSKEDIRVTKDLRTVLEPTGVNLYDHVIVSQDDCASMRILGMID